MQATENRSALARAMLSFSDDSESGEVVGIDPARVDHLLGEPPSWRFPALLCLAGLSVIALMTAVAVLAGQVASGSATLAAPFLSSRPCIVVLALIPADFGSDHSAARSQSLVGTPARSGLTPSDPASGTRRSRGAPCVCVRRLRLLYPA